MKKKAQAEVITRDMISSEFIPYACHYSPETLLTKNGELLQVIKITDSGGTSDYDFRQALRNAINSAIDPSRFAVWIHTVRSKSEGKSYDEGDYPQYIDYIWRQHLPIEIHYRNEIYISIVIDSSKYEPWKAKDYIRSLSRKAEINYRLEELSEKEEKLSEVSSKIVEALELYSAEQLGLYEQNGIYYSELIEFARLVMGVEYEKMPLPISDLSYKIRLQHIDFNSYTGIFETVQNNKKKYGAIISIKENIGMTAAALQNLLNSDSEFILSQSIDFAFGNRYLPAIKEQVYLNTVSNDKKFATSAHLKDASSSNPDNYVLQQICISVTQNSMDELNQSIESLQKDLHALGIVAYVEDINLERTYYSQLPANFAFLKRQDTMPRELIGSFACFGVDKYSSIEDCLFGKPAIMFENHDQEIFALHFLSNGQGHILIVGAEESRRQQLANLIATESLNIGAGIVMYDYYGKYSKFAEVTGAQYFTGLDLDKIAGTMDGTTKIIIINSLKLILDNNGHDAFSDFLEFAGSKSCIVVACEEYENNSELLLSDFTTSIFFPCEEINERFADNYDIFEDERQIIQSLNPKHVYVRHGYEEMILKFSPIPKLANALITGIME